MILVYIIIILDCVLITLEEHGNVNAKNHKLEEKRDASGQQDNGSEANGPQFSFVHQHPDVHELHVHIHEGKSVYISEKHILHHY